MRIGCEQNPATHALRDDGVGGGGGRAGGVDLRDVKISDCPPGKK